MPSFRSRPPLVAILKVFDGRHEVELIFDSAWELTQSKVKLGYRRHDRPADQMKRIILEGKNVGGGLRVRWTNPPAELDLTNPGRPGVPQRLIHGLRTAARVAQTFGVEDGFPIPREATHALRCTPASTRATLRWKRSTACPADPAGM